MREIVILILVAISSVCCEKNDNNPDEDKLPIKQYDDQYFKAIINGDSISVNELTNSKIFTQIGFESTEDSVVLNYGLTVKDEINNSFTLNIWFVVKEMVANLDTIDLYHWEYLNVNDLNNVISNNSWNYIIDSNYSSVGSLLDTKRKSYTGIYITYRSDDINWYSAINDTNSQLDIKIINNYVKPVIIDYAQDNSGKMMVDSVLYVEGEIDCILSSRDSDEKIEIKNAKFKGDIFTKEFEMYQ